MSILRHSAHHYPARGRRSLAATFPWCSAEGANQAIAAIRAGAPTYMIGAVGEDMFRDLTLTTLAAEGIDVSGVRITDGATGIAHIRVDTASAQNDIMIIPNANHRLNRDDVADSLTRLRDRVSVVLVQLDIPLSVVERVAEVCQALELRLVVDPAPAYLATGGVARTLDGEAERAGGGSADWHCRHRSQLCRAGSAMVSRRWRCYRDDHPGRSGRGSDRARRCRGLSGFSSNAG